MKPRHIGLAGALAVAAGFAFFGDKSASNDVVEAAPRQVAKSQSARAPASLTKMDKAAPAILALIPRDQLIAAGDAQAGVFNAQNWNPPPPPPPKPAPPPPPTAPALPFTYLGKAQQAGGGAWEVFLARGAETLIVRPQMVVDGVYRIDTIAPPSMTLTYLPLKQVQQMNIGVPD